MCSCHYCNRFGMKERCLPISCLNKLPKKGESGPCTNWRGIMFLSTPSKVLSRVIMERIKDALDTVSPPELAGFRKGQSYTDRIATLRIVITEQSIEWQSNPLPQLH
ncbi:unnamed protein product [Trichobilharzia szidati]|nr:unnamed protein product [Trichobilharzia szidati]